MFERLRRREDVVFDPDVAHAALIYDDMARPILEAVHRQYIDIAQRHALPMLVSASTWRANGERVARSRHAGAPVNQQNIAFARQVADAGGSPGAPLFVAGTMGPAGDAYRAGEAPDREAAMRFHEYQVDALADGCPDLLMAATLPALPEALGIAQLLGATALPYLLSFVVREGGMLLDGTPLAVALDRIDNTCPQPPVGYMVNCVHPDVLDRCLDVGGSAVAGRVLGLRANTSTLRPEQLDDAESLVTQPADELATHMATTQRRHGLKILGGCCGTGTEHIEQIAVRCARAA